MVFSLQLPAELTDAEKKLMQTYEKLRKLKKAVQAQKAIATKVEDVGKRLSVDTSKQSMEQAKGITEEVKRLVKSGAMTINKTEEKQTFKRSHVLNRKLKDSDKPSTASGSLFGDFGMSETFNEVPKAKVPKLYSNFVPSESTTAGRSETAAADQHENDAQETPKRGATIYIRGYDLTEEPIRKAFSKCGTIIRLFVEERRKGAFVTYGTCDDAEKAIREMNGNMVGGITLRVSLARRQFVPRNSQAWSQLASESGPKGPHHRDSRDAISYDDYFN